MDTPQQQNPTENHEDKQREEEGKPTEESNEGRQSPVSAIPSTPSASSSPSHEFSFTISLHPSSPSIQDKTKSPPSFAIDLSPADDIFFHGHLLPLHLLSHLPVSPRSSTNSLDSFTLPIKDLVDDQRPTHNHPITTNEKKERIKSKSFSLFGLSKWKKGYEVREKEDKEKKKKKRKMKLELGQVLKKYVRIFRSKEREEIIEFKREPCTFSGNLSFREKEELRGRRGEFSAPASMRTSPTNSGLLLATAAVPSSKSDSTMEELQAAIQAAIAHCKNSIAAEDKLKC